MTTSDLVARWTVGVVAAVVVVLVVAVLLVLIIDQAKGILAAAVRCLDAVGKIRPNVEPIWELETTNRVAQQLVGGAQSIEGHAKLLADTLEATTMTPSATGR